MRDRVQLYYDSIYTMIVRPPKVASVMDTIQYVVDHHCSVSRYGDAEMKVLHHDNISYQTNSARLDKELIRILQVPVNNHIVCLPDAFENLEKYADEQQGFWKWHLSYYRSTWYKYLVKGRQYYNTHMTRCYLMYRDKSHTGEYFRLMKTIWDGKDIILVEGKNSRLGVGNDLFDNAKSIKRILGPQVSAFDQYDDIYAEVLRHITSDCVILLALGPTATVLAYHLAEKGYQAVDVGNIDTEYEWYKMGAMTKVPIPNKYVHEAGGLHSDDSFENREYLNQIVKEFN